MKEELSRTPEYWKEKPQKEYIEYAAAQFHLPLKERMPKLIFFADKVENVHGKNENCPSGLTNVLQSLTLTLTEHIENKEEIDSYAVKAKEKFNTIKESFVSIRKIANDYKPPADACGTWTFLYQQLEILEKDIQDYIHLEENILFS